MPATGWPSRVALRSMTTLSPVRASRSTGASSAKLPRSRSTWAWIVLLGDLGVGDRHLQRLVALQLELGPDLDHGVEGQRARSSSPAVTSISGSLMTSTALSLTARSYQYGMCCSKRLVPGRRPADPRLQHPAGRLPGPETGHPQLSGELGERLVDGLFDLGFLHLDRELDLVALQWSDLGFHMRCGAYCAGAPPGAAPAREPASGPAVGRALSTYIRLGGAG